jgi:predicted glutamine amidotransferase
MWYRRILPAFLLLLAAGQPAFACRLEAVMGPRQPSPGIWREETAFLRASLVDDANSLKKESAKRPPKQNNYDFEDLISGFRERGNMDGWGLIHYGCDIQDSQLPQAFKNTAPAFADRQYDQAVRQSLTQNAGIMMAHIRRASPEYNQVNLSNAHPFTYQNWSFMHNGSVSGAFSSVVEGKISQYREKLGGGPKGTTDSEHVFYFVLANLQDVAGTLDSKQIPTETVQKVFAQSVEALVANSKPQYSPLDGSVLNLQGEVQGLPVCNFVLSDGMRLFAYRQGFNLYLGQKTLSNGQHLYLVTSEKTHTTDKSVKWLLLPERHLLTISWDETGNPVPSLLPLTRLTSSETSSVK